MKVFRNYMIAGEHQVLLSVLENMKKHISSPFVYDGTETKTYARGIMRDDTEVACFKTKRVSLYESKVFVYVSGNKLVVANVLSSMVASLGRERYNQVVEAFSVAVSDCLYGNIQVELSSSDFIMEHQISAEAFSALRTWVETCPKDAPFDHPLDEERWFRFILAIKDSENRLDASVLGRWLREDMAWPIGCDDQVDEIEDKYSYSIRLLKFYDSQNKK